MAMSSSTIIADRLLPASGHPAHDLASASVPVVPDDRLLPADVRPPRVNLAGICAYCNERGCTSERCVQRWQASRWALCPECDGTEMLDGFLPCWCTSGAVETRELPEFAA
jgi:hypothetical protein